MIATKLPLHSWCRLVSAGVKVPFLGSLLKGHVLWCLLYYLLLYYEPVKERTPAISCIALCHETLPVAPWALVVGFLIITTAKHLWAIWLGWFWLLWAWIFSACQSVHYNSYRVIPEAQHENWDKDTFPSGRLCHSGLHQRSAIAVGLFSVLLVLRQVTGVAIGWVAFQNHGADKIQLKEAHTNSIPII